MNMSARSRLQFALLKLMASWLSVDELTTLHQAGKDAEVGGEAYQDIIPIVVTKILDTPERGRELMGLLSNGSNAADITEFIGKGCRWIDEHAESRANADDRIAAFSDACGLHCERVPGGYSVRPIVESWDFPPTTYTIQ
jgi:hypothetical protein